MRKILVTNRTALDSRYGVAGRQHIETAVNSLIAADAARGITTSLMFLDVAGAIGPSARVVTVPSDPQQNKDAIDHVVSAHAPDHVVILGAPDVVPHVTLANPVVDDPDANVPSDLPYACSAPYSTDAGDFVAPSRSVSRIPGINGSPDPAYLVNLLDAAATLVTQPAAAFAAYFSVSADVWRASTALSLNAIFGNAAALAVAPPDGPARPPARYGANAQFFNLHGATNDDRWYGQLGMSFPVALAGTDVAGNVARGAVVASEACYGGELYPPGTGVGTPICNVYLAGGCAGFFGSTTVAYGPAATNGSADLITQYFVKEMLAGRTVGDAGLAARVQFVHATSTMTPVNLKTLAQFLVLGDGSGAPVEAPAIARALAAPKLSAAAARRVLVPVLSEAPLPHAIERTISAQADAIGLEEPRTRTYVMRPASAAFGAVASALSLEALPQTRVHVTVDYRAAQQKGVTSQQPLAFSVIEVVETDGAVVGVQTYYRR